jgi:hypothetical protein
MYVLGFSSMMCCLYLRAIEHILHLLIEDIAGTLVYFFQLVARLLGCCQVESQLVPSIHYQMLKYCDPNGDAFALCNPHAAHSSVIALVTIMAWQ